MLDLLPTGAASLSVVVVAVEDDAPLLEGCLQSLDPPLDDVLVVEVREQPTARRRPSTWRPPPGWGGARLKEEASARVSGEWVLHVRAGEVLEGDLPLLLRRLALSQADVVEIQVTGSGQGREPRLVRRSSVQWLGSTGEVPTGRGGRRLNGADFQPPVRLRQQRTTPVRPQTTRAPFPPPARISADAGECWSALEHARWWAEAGRPSEALQWLQALVAAAEDPALILQAVWVAASAAAGRPVRASIDPAHESIDEAAASFARHSLAAGDAHLAAKALRAVVAHGVDTRVHAAGSHISVERASTTELLAQVVRELGRPYESALLLLRTTTLPEWSLDLEGVLDVFASAGCDFAELAAVVHPVALESFERQAHERPSRATSRWLLSRAASMPEDAERLRRGARAAAVLDVRAALPWALLVRRNGMPDGCPLRLMARGGVVDATQTLLAAQVLAACFGETEAIQRLAAEMRPQDFDAIHFDRELEALVDDAREEL